MKTVTSFNVRRLRRDLLKDLRYDPNYYLATRPVLERINRYGRLSKSFEAFTRSQRLKDALSILKHDQDLGICDTKFVCHEQPIIRGVRGKSSALISGALTPAFLDYLQRGNNLPLDLTLFYFNHKDQLKPLVIPQPNPVLRQRVEEARGLIKDHFNSLPVTSLTKGMPSFVRLYQAICQLLWGIPGNSIQRYLGIQEFHCPESWWMFLDDANLEIFAMALEEVPHWVTSLETVASDVELSGSRWLASSGIVVPVIKRGVVAQLDGRAA